MKYSPLIIYRFFAITTAGIGLVFFPFCKDTKTTFTTPLKPSAFIWGKEATASIDRIQKVGWRISQQASNNKQIKLYLPYTATTIRNEKQSEKESITKMEGLSVESSSNIAELYLYLDKGHLSLARIIHHLKQDESEIYLINFKKNYDLNKAIWTSKRQTDRLFQDDKNRVATKKMASLYERNDIFVALHRTMVESSEQTLSKGRNHSIEVILYSKKNPGLTGESLIQILKGQYSSVASE